MKNSAALQSLLKRYSIKLEEFYKLQNIGGHSKYHLEGNALTHTIMVFRESLTMFPNNEVMQKAALLHDIGKLYSSIEITPNDWIYPDHSICGSCKGVLAKFIDLKDPYFTDYQWLIRNHIKPLFWKEKGVVVDEVWGELHPEVSNLDNLRKLAICDLLGSKPKVPSTALIEYLRTLEL